MDRNKRFWCIEGYEGETCPIVDGKHSVTNSWLTEYINKITEENKTLKEENNQLKKENNKIIEIIDDKIKKIEDNLSLNQTGERKDYNWNVILAGMGMIDLLNNIKREYEGYLNE